MTFTFWALPLSDLRDFPHFKGPMTGDHPVPWKMLLTWHCVRDTVFVVHICVYTLWVMHALFQAGIGSLVLLNISCLSWHSCLHHSFLQYISYPSLSIQYLFRCLICSALPVCDMFCSVRLWYVCCVCLWYVLLCSVCLWSILFCFVHLQSSICPGLSMVSVHCKEWLVWTKKKKKKFYKLIFKRQNYLRDLST